MPRAISSIRSYRDTTAQLPREPSGRSSRDEQLAALDAAFRRIWSDSDAGSSVYSNNVTNVSTVNLASGRCAHEPSEVSDQSTVCWSDYGGSNATLTTRRPRADPSMTSNNVTQASIVDWSSPPLSPPPPYEANEISEISDQSTVCWSDYGGSSTTSSTRRPHSNTVIFHRSNVEPASLSRETFLPISDINDSSAIQIILALIHDCLLAIDKLFNGHRPPDVFEHRYRLLSLYVVDHDISIFQKPLSVQGLIFRHSMLEELISLRQKTLFIIGEELDTARRTRGRIESAILLCIVGKLREEPLVDASPSDQLSFWKLIGYVECYLGTPLSCSDDLNEISKLIRSFLAVPPVSDVDECCERTEVTPAREIAMLRDIFFGLWGVHTKAFSGPCNIHYISLSNDSRRTRYSGSHRLRHIHSLVLCRDVVCGLLPGPSTLTLKGAYTFLRPVFSEMRRNYSYWTCLSAEDHDVFENYITSHFLEVFEEKINSAKDFQVRAVRSMMDYMTDLYKRYFSSESSE
ncbi:hypothetical protein BDZ89DRAFT_1139167 [Hymenopellis radicata]|nr:hypothetical protein BDZ89DRAFT_1139167 [Hymenopellis radicata]